MNIYVGNLPFDARESDLRSLFADYGNIDSASVIHSTWCCTCSRSAHTSSGGAAMSVATSIFTTA